MKCIIFAFLVIIVVAMAAPQEEQKKCIPWNSKPCIVDEDCCRYLKCAFYRAQCMQIYGIIIPGEDKRPLGPGPYPPNVPKNELPQ